jgi:hypothetical protein
LDRLSLGFVFIDIEADKRLIFMMRLRTFCKKPNNFGVKSRIGVLKLRKVVFGFRVNDSVLEERLILVGMMRIGGFGSSITQNSLFLHDFE